MEKVEAFSIWVSIPAALVLPGKHSVEFRYSTRYGYAEAIFALRAEAGKTYLLRAQPTQDRKKVSFWIEDVETCSKVGFPMATLVTHYKAAFQV